jgi:hypothetical protein
LMIFRIFQWLLEYLHSSWLGEWWQAPNNSSGWRYRWLSKLYRTY